MNPGRESPARSWPYLVEHADVRDYLAIARYHARPAPPALVERVLVVRADAATPVAALVVARPTLNAPWRQLAWPDEFAPCDAREEARKVNALVRVIARVVVDPRYRGRGLASSLVRAYLASPLTPLTEAIAAMAAACPIFAAAGMTPQRVNRSSRDFALARALGAMGIQAWQLADGAAVASLIQHAPFRRALRAWCEASRATRAMGAALRQDTRLSLVQQRQVLAAAGAAALALTVRRTVFTARFSAGSGRGGDPGAHTHGHQTHQVVLARRSNACEPRTRNQESSDKEACNQERRSNIQCVQVDAGARRRQ